MTKTEIVDAAFKVWGRDLYRKTSLSQVAKELGVSKPALYRHFENKQALTKAMTERFCDDFASSVRADFEKALQEDADDGIFTIIQSVAGFFARNVYAHIFSLINIYDRSMDGHIISERIRARGVDMGTISIVIEKKYNAQYPAMQLVFATVTFYMSYFHKINHSFEKTPSAEKIQSVISTINRLTKNGMGFSHDEAGALDFNKLEKQVEDMTINAKPEPLFKAVAEAVAEAGPWDASMDMVAKRMGLSKSSLYGHFKNKKDMLRRLFLSEFRRILEFARQGINLSANTAEQLYLGIYSIAVYLRLRPEILVAIGWIRTRKLDLGKPDKNTDIFKLFGEIEYTTTQNINEEERQLISHWILFLLINILMHPYLSDNNFNVNSNKKTQNNDIRVLYKLITLGLGGFLR
ncbi:MAG: TetR/AcrR family transcriptional regulator [Treponema sp.]|jgi:AcrR family transcriptional regulator|nr:TetR/AcrR family transcriptional regulator [Treponema sp.]